MFNHEEINEILFETELNEEDQQYHQMLTIMGCMLRALKQTIGLMIFERGDSLCQEQPL